jgi:hypothetical protein
MAPSLEIPLEILGALWSNIRAAPLSLLALIFITLLLSAFVFVCTPVPTLLLFPSANKI